MQSRRAGILPALILKSLSDGTLTHPTPKDRHARPVAAMATITGEPRPQVTPG